MSSEVVSPMLDASSTRNSLLETLRNDGEPTQEAEAALRTYASALMHLLAHEERLRLGTLARKGETKK
jgi:hypothetical protein